MHKAADDIPFFHHVLTYPLILERLPWWLTLALLGGAAVVSTLTWRNTRLLLAILLLGTSLLDWLILAGLPRTGRSFGPVKPPLLALAALRALITVSIGLLVAHTWVVLSTHALITALIIYATWVEPFRLTISYQTIRSPRLDPTKSPIRLLHLSDLHVERLTRREIELQRRIDDLAPDLIVFTGDFVNLSYRDDPTAARQIQAILSRWQAPLGVYCVSGTPLVEGAQHVARFIDGTGIRWLRDERVTIDAGGHNITLYGFDGALKREDILPRLDARVGAYQKAEGFRMLLYHTPEVAPEAASLGFDLYLCGHTHGGQIRLPLYGALFTASALGKRFEMGRYQVDDMTLYVSRGIGMEGGIAPRARFLCPPEIILWTIGGLSD